MAWTTPRVWTSGAVSAADMNETSDNLDWLKAALTTHGVTSDSVVGVLQTARYGVSAAVTSFAIPDATDKAVDFASADEWDDDDFHDPASQNDRFFAPVTGTYVCTGWGKFDADSSGYRQGWVEKNDTTEYNKISVASAGGAVATSVMVVVELELTANDYLNLRLRQNTGSSLDADARFQMRLIAV